MGFIKNVVSSFFWKIFIYKNRKLMKEFEKKYLRIADYRYKNSSIYSDFNNDRDIFEKTLKKDFEEIERLAMRLTVSSETLIGRNNLLKTANERFFALSLDQKRKIKDFYKTLYFDMIKINTFSKKYEMNVGRFKEDEKRYIFESYLLGFVSAFIEYNTILTLVRNITNNDMRFFLDEQTDILPKNSFSNLEMKLYNRWYFTRVHIFERYQKTYMVQMYDSNKNYYDKEKWLYNYIKFNQKLISELPREIFREKTLLDLFEKLDWKKFKGYIYPLQVKLFTWIGDAKVKRKHSNLISDKQVIEAVLKMQPGDIIVERRNWYLSNIFLGGFWPHGAFYCGTSKDIDCFFKDDCEVLEFLNKNNCKTPGEFLKKNFPQKWDMFLKGNKNGDYSIIEATSEGVIFNDPIHSLQADFVGVMRPRLRKIDKFLAIRDAFYYHGREYDFDFDFVSENTIVCTELVTKVYGEDSNKKGIHFLTSSEYGKEVVKANFIVKKFDIEYNTENQELDFVYYIEGIEKKGKAEFSDAEKFRKSYKIKGKIAT